MRRSPSLITVSSTRWAFLLYLLLAGLFYAPILLGLRTFPDGDFTHHFLPFSLFQQREWLAGHWLPVWNPFTYAGHPFLADTQAAVFYPLGDLLLLLTLPFTSPAARLYFLQLEAALHVALGGFFTFLLVRALVPPGRHLAAFTAGGLFAFSGYLTGYPPLQLAILRTAIWLPLLLWLLLRACQRPRRWRYWIGAALAYASAFLAGHPQTFLYLSYTVVGWVFLLLWPFFLAVKRESGAAVQRLIGVLSFYFLTMALSAGQLLPSLEFTRYSVRARVAYDFVSAGFPLQDTWQLLLPGVLTQFSPLYVGIVGLALAVPAFARPFPPDGDAQRRAAVDPFPANRRSRFLLFFALLVLVGLLLSYGQHSFLYPLFYRYLPGWNLFRGQERAAYLVVLGLSILAGYGLAALPDLSLRRRRVVALFVAAAALGGVGGFAWGWQLPGRTAIGRGEFVSVAAISLLFVAGVVALLWGKQWRWWRTGGLVVLAVANLFWANFTTNVSPLSPARKTILAPEMAALKRAALEDSGTNLGVPGRAYNEFRVYEDYGMRTGVEDVWGSSPLRLARYAALFDDFPLDRMWRLTGVEHVLTWRRQLFEPSELLAEFPQATDTTFLHRLSEPNPRAWLVRQVRAVNDQDALALLADHRFDLESTALLPLSAAEGLVTAGKAGFAAQIRLSRPASNRLRLEVESETGGLLVVSENWLPGWRAETVPGSEPLPVLRADLTLLAVPLPPGSHSFELRYWPDSLRDGLGISGGALLLLALAGLWTWGKRRG